MDITHTPRREWLLSKRIPPRRSEIAPTYSWLSGSTRMKPVEGSVPTRPVAVILGRKQVPVSSFALAILSGIRGNPSANCSAIVIRQLKLHRRFGGYPRWVTITAKRSRI